MILSFGLFPVSALQQVLSQDIEFIDSDIINVDKVFTYEGDGVIYSFDYDLLEGTQISWSLESSSSDTFFDFLIFDDLENPFTDTLVELYDQTENTDSTVIPHGGEWYIYVRHSRFHGNYTLHVTGTVQQIGTPVKEDTIDTTVTTSQTTYPLSTPVDGTPFGDWIFVLAFGIIGVLCLILVYMVRFYESPVTEETHGNTLEVV